ncbi:Solute carrier family 2, facilitated glucose transporter member 3 [Aphelenchoides besseyi]|nr:Solute carrier family 2, facilitated glucose transporter member 3 [Aphelenchoides besseyi]KAI6211099.1 Solute carrier family 2, facilitated glucose transporter member 3 [Aphelenchoides besseyi]
MDQNTSISYWSWKQTVKLFCIGILLTLTTNFPSAFTHTSVNTAGDTLDHYINVSYVNRNWELNLDEHTFIKVIINNCWYVGQTIGAVLTPVITDHYGRKPAYLLATAIMTLACALQSLSTFWSYPEMLVASRTLASIFSPMSDAVAILYLQEISPTHYRGTLSSLFSTGFAGMGCFGMLMGMKSILGDSLTGLLFVPVVPGILSLVLLAVLPETPKFLLISKKNVEGARRSLIFYQGASPQIEFTLDEYQCEAKEEEVGEARMTDLFRVPYLRRAMILTFMIMTLVLPFYSILQYSTTLLRMVGISDTIAEWSSFLLGIEMLVGCIIAAALLNRFQRRSLVIVFGFASMISILIFAICGAFVQQLSFLKYGALMGMFAYIACWSAAVGPISNFIGPELVQLQYRSTMFCVCFALSNVFIFASNGSALALFRKFGAISFVPLYVVPSAVALVYIWYYLPETKDKETHVIVGMLKGGRRRACDAVPELLVKDDLKF